MPYVVSQVYQLQTQVWPYVDRVCPNQTVARHGSRWSARSYKRLPDRTNWWQEFWQKVSMTRRA